MAARFNHILVADRIWLGRFEGRPADIRSLDQVLYDDFATLKPAREAEDIRILGFVTSVDDDSLDRWASRVRAWAKGSEPADAERVMPPTTSRRTKRDVYVYFDNDVKVRAPADAAALAERLDASPPAADDLGEAAPRGRAPTTRRNEAHAVRQATARPTWPHVRSAYRSNRRTSP